MDQNGFGEFSVELGTLFFKKYIFVTIEGARAFFKSTIGRNSGDIQTIDGQFVVWVKEDVAQKTQPIMKEN